MKYVTDKRKVKNISMNEKSQQQQQQRNTIRKSGKTKCMWESHVIKPK